MRSTHKTNRLRTAVIAAAAAGLTAVALAVPASAASTPDTGGAGSAGAVPNVRNAALASLRADGLSAQAATHRLSTQASSVRILDKVADSLGDSAAGSYLDSHGNPVVNVVDSAAATTARAAGARAKVVPNSTAELTSVTKALDRMRVVPNTAWGVDPVTDKVVLTLSDATPDAGAAQLRATANRFGDMVRIEHISQPLTEQVYDGDSISTGQIICSAGFNVTKGGQNYIITAGHCTQGLPSWQGIGPSVDSQFPGNDFGIIRNDSSSAPGAVNMYDGSTQPITSVGDATVGEQVCKSGQTTNLTCGTVQALNQTVHYADGASVSGLIQTDVTCDHGDSGGPLFDGSTGLGTVSGGNTSTEYFQPLGEAMSNYGASLA